VENCGNVEIADVDYRMVVTVKSASARVAGVTVPKETQRGTSCIEHRSVLGMALSQFSKETAG